MEGGFWEQWEDWWYALAEDDADSDAISLLVRNQKVCAGLHGVDLDIISRFFYVWLFRQLSPLALDIFS